jgi:flagellar export protein FliJ
MTSERIARVLDLKRFTKEQLEAEARQRREELRVEKERLERLERLFDETVRKFNERHESGLLERNDLELYYDYIAYMERSLKEQKTRVEEKKKRLAEKEREVLTAHREKRLVEILHDNTIREEIRESLIREQKEMDMDFLMRRLRR